MSFRPRLKMVLKPRKSPKQTKTLAKTHNPLPRLITIGNSVGLVISKPMLQSIGWRKGDAIEYEFDDAEKRLVVRNLSAEQRDSNAVHKKTREDY
jgi:antitoxin component of MazEF toxin-antitoxin module